MNQGIIEVRTVLINQRSLLKCWNFYKSEELCDVILMGKETDEKINCHRLILALASETFRAIFKMPMSSHIFHQIPTQILKSIVQLIYKGRCCIKNRDWDDFMAAAKFFKIKMNENGVVWHETSPGSGSSVDIELSTTVSDIESNDENISENVNKGTQMKPEAIDDQIKNTSISGSAKRRRRLSIDCPPTATNLRCEPTSSEIQTESKQTPKSSIIDSTTERIPLKKLKQTLAEVLGDNNEKESNCAVVKPGKLINSLQNLNLEGGTSNKAHIDSPKSASLQVSLERLPGEQIQESGTSKISLIDLSNSIKKERRQSFANNNKETETKQRPVRMRRQSVWFSNYSMNTDTNRKPIEPPRRNSLMVESIKKPSTIESSGEKSSVVKQTVKKPAISELPEEQLDKKNIYPQLQSFINSHKNLTYSLDGNKFYSSKTFSDHKTFACSFKKCPARIIVYEKLKKAHLTSDHQHFLVKKEVPEEEVVTNRIKILSDTRLALDDKYKFHFNSENGESKRYRCKMYGKSCYAKIYIDKSGNATLVDGNHSHAPDPDLIQTRKTLE